MEIIKYAEVDVLVDASFNDLNNYIEGTAVKQIFLIDEHVYTAWQHQFENRPVIVIPAGEDQKSLQYVEKIINQLSAMYADRNTLLIGVGGGVVCDITGFVASVFMRGITFVLVPTTLLAMVDASIGGKNGVNTSLGKNLIGVINQPHFILCDIMFLQTLPKAEIINGMAEVIKHACIESEEYFQFIQQNWISIFDLEKRTLIKLITESVRIKCGIVSKDPKEQNVRRTLNYGHTYGHAFEKAFNIPHGQAVSLGIVSINKWSVANGFMTLQTAGRIKKLLKQVGLPIECKNTVSNHLNHFIRVDKKRTDLTINLVVVTEIGKSKIVETSIADIIL